MQFLGFAVCLALASAVAALELPSGITLCKKTDSKCMLAAVTQAVQAFAEGKKEFRVPKLDPLLLKKIHIPGSGGSIDVEQTYTDTYLHGATKIVPESLALKVSDSEYVFNLGAHADKLEMIGTYEAKGKLLLFTINGGGACNVTMRNLDTKIDIYCEVYDKGGESHLRVKKLDLDLGSGTVAIDYENLVNNNALLSKTVLDAVNENSEVLHSFFQKDFERVMGDALHGILNLVFDAVPLSNLFLD